MGINNRYKVMAKEVSALNTYWLLQYLKEHHPWLDQEDLIAQIARLFPCYLNNLQSGIVEPVRLEHLQNPRYWFSHQFVKKLHDLIEKKIPDPRLGFKIGSTMYKTQPLIRTAVAIPLLGVTQVAHKVSREAAKFNRTKQYQVRKVDKGLVEIRIVHNPGIVISEFTMQWNAGCFASYAKLAGATAVTVDLHCVDPGPEYPESEERAVWDFEIRFTEPPMLKRLAKALLFSLPWVQELTERAAAIEDEHQEQILDRDNLIRERTAILVSTNMKMAVEIAERKRARNALLQSRGELQRIVAAIGDIGLGLCVINADYRLSNMNKTMIDWFGENHGQKCYEVIFDQNRPCSHCGLNDVVDLAEKINYQSSMPDGRSFEIVATPIVDDEGSRSKMVIFRETTEQKQQEDRRLELSRQKEELARLASLKNMAGAIAHRFNNAMVVVRGNLELLLLALPEKSNELQMASHAFQAAKDASQIGSSMLSYVGQVPLKLRNSSLIEIVKDAVDESRELLDPAIEVRFKSFSSPLNCPIDGQQLKEVFENILTNSVESLAEGLGTIEISFATDYFEKDDFPVFFQDGNLRDGMYALCQIKDSGEGISAENMARVFEPFYTTKFVGRGLGLALSVGILQAHHGAMTFDSVPGQGTTVRVMLPLLEVSSEVKDLPSESGNPAL